MVCYFCVDFLQCVVAFSSMQLCLMNASITQNPKRATLLPLKTYRPQLLSTSKDQSSRTRFWHQNEAFKQTPTATAFHICTFACRSPGWSCGSNCTLPWHNCMWRVKFIFQADAYGHMVHLCCFSPVWVRMCDAKWLFLAHV